MTSFGQGVAMRRRRRGTGFGDRGMRYGRIISMGNLSSAVFGAIAMLSALREAHSLRRRAGGCVWYVEGELKLDKAVEIMWVQDRKM